MMKYKKNISALGVSVLTAVMVLMSAWIMPACSDDNGGDLKGATLSVTADGVDITDMEFSTYGGQQLETDWKTSTRRFCDITFRALLIMHYSKNE